MDTGAGKMSFKPEHEMHRRRFSRNLGLGLVLVENWSNDARNFGEAPIPRMPQLPGISVHLVDHGEPPSGAGETAIVAAGAAIANAVRAATGWRLRQLPLNPGDLQRHLKGQS